MSEFFWIEAYIGSSLTALILAGVIIPQILLIAFRRRLFDDQDERKIHKGAVPRLGGFAFVPSIVFSMFLMIGIFVLYSNPYMMEALRLGICSLLFLVCALMLIFLTGMADDLIGVRYKAKFVCQILTAVLLICAGAVFMDFEGMFGLWVLPKGVAWVLSVLVIVYIINALNLIDGIDGLASGLSIVAMIYYGLMLNASGMHIHAMLAWTTVGTLLPFFYYNFFGDATKQKKIFMGDTGSLSIGTLMSFLALTMTNVTDFKEFDDYNPLICAFAPIIVPTFDVCRVYWHRVRNGRNPFLPDRCHIHHKLLALGLTTRKALAMILMISVFFLVCNVLLSRVWNPTVIFFVDIIVWIGGNVLLTKIIRQREKRLGMQLYQ